MEKEVSIVGNTVRLKLKEQVVGYNYGKFPWFIQNEPYKNTLSLAAKYLYVLMYNRMEVSIKNRFADKDGEIIIHFPRKEAAESLGCGHSKCVETFKELIKSGLIEDVQVGVNKQNIIYVRVPSLLRDIDGSDNFINGSTDSLETFGGLQTRPRRSANQTKEVCKPDSRKKDISNKVTLSKDKGVSKQTLTTLIEQLFFPKKNLLVKPNISKIELAKLLASVNGNTQKKEKCILKICLAKVSGDWKTIKGQDLAYWYKLITFPKAYSKPMLGDVQEGKTLFTNWLLTGDDLVEEIFYSMTYWKVLYPKYAKRDSNEDATLATLNLNRARLNDFFDQAINNARRFISQGYIDGDIRLKVRTEAAVRDAAAADEGDEEVLF